MVKSAKAKAAEKAAEKAQNDQMYFNIKYPMTNQAVINFGQCRICGVEVEINVPNDVDVLGKHYTTNHQVFDVVVDKGSKIRRVHQERNSLAAEGNCIFTVSIKNKWSVATNFNFKNKAFKSLGIQTCKFSLACVVIFVSQLWVPVKRSYHGM